MMSSLRRGAGRRVFGGSQGQRLDPRQMLMACESPPTPLNESIPLFEWRRRREFERTLPDTRCRNAKAVCITATFANGRSTCVRVSTACIYSKGFLHQPHASIQKASVRSRCSTETRYGPPCNTQSHQPSTDAAPAVTAVETDEPHPSTHLPVTRTSATNKTLRRRYDDSGATN